MMVPSALAFQSCAVEPSLKAGLTGRAQLKRNVGLTLSCKPYLSPTSTTSLTLVRRGEKRTGQRALHRIVATSTTVRPKEEDAQSVDRNGATAESEEATFAPSCTVFDYGFQAEFLNTGPTVPGNVITLALDNFGKEWRALRRNYLYEEPPSLPEGVSMNPWQSLGNATIRGSVFLLRSIDKLLTLYDGLPVVKPKPLKGGEESDELRQKLNQLQLSNKNVWAREHSRPAVEAPWWILGPYYALCIMLDVLFDGRAIQRFWFLETVARMPYMSYISMLHLYETLGWWRAGSDVRKVHFAEEWNEMHHLKIMEALGGDRYWIDRFLGQHAAIFYYWAINVMFLVSPKVAYNFSELVESHAVDTYAEFVDSNEELLKSLPAPPVALQYYQGGDLYMFDEFQTSRPAQSRRVKIQTLYDVFCNIRDDEAEHVKTMVACQQLKEKVVSPNRVLADELPTDVIAVQAKAAARKPANGGL